MYMSVGTCDRMDIISFRYAIVNNSLKKSMSKDIVAGLIYEYNNSLFSLLIVNNKFEINFTLLEKL
jgi:hypothetical protein